ncbi:MAG: hypothetical protein JST61_16425 [Acidobacteria bacterium]|nr:hypothetical protein [Acidobacteriota bacterium]
MVVAETVLYAAIACGERRKAEDRMINFSSEMPNIVQICAASESVPLITGKSLEQAINDDFSTIPEVHGIRIEHDNGEVMVKIHVSDPPREVRYKIYDKQTSFIEAFPEITFDFSLAPVE